MARGTKSKQLLTDRTQYLFKILMERYLSDGQPVGSRTLAKDAGLDLSPATIRNVMADLEDMGLICSPHTSAGRMPTARGYRLFVDSLLTVKQPLTNEVELMLRDLSTQPDLHTLVEKASNMLSEVTRLVGVVMIPRAEQRALRHVEFLPLSESRVLVILVLNDHEVQNRVIHTDRPYTDVELQQATNYLNQVFKGRDLQAVRARLTEEMHHQRDEVNRMMQAVTEMAQKAFDVSPADKDYVLAGQTNLMGISELANMDKLRQLFEAFQQKYDMLRLLDQALAAEGIQIFIGEESGYQFLDNCSLVTSTYQAEGKVLGVLGVIGPTRMPYERVIPVVDMTARILSSALKSLN